MKNEIKPLISKSTITYDELVHIFNNSYDGLMISDHEGNLIFNNKAVSIILNVKSEELLGKNVRDLVRRGLYDNSVILKAIETGVQQTGIVNLHNGNTVVSTSTPMLDENQKVKMTVTNVRMESVIDQYAKELEKQKCHVKRYKSAIHYMNSLNTNSNKVIAESIQMRRLLKYLSKVSKMNSTVLLTGESGTGKEVVSRFIHDNSLRSREPFIPVNCSAIPKELMESEFFGFEKGAFTGAIKSKPGFFEMADKGTLFLDEIAEMTMNIQTKFLRVLESGVIQRLGSTNPIQTDVRIIAATNKNLEERVNDNRFRKDLYYRLNVIPVTIPPLRERKEDIVPLAQYFIDQINSEYDSSKILSESLIEKMLNYNWPGNIRELKNIVERFYILSNEEEFFISENIKLDQSNLLRNGLSNTSVTNDFNTEFTGDLKAFVKEAEKVYIKRVLNSCKWQIGEAAKELGIHRSMLYRKMQEYNICKNN
ncbi:MAG: sigma 54-interacting transcriptional regulator [Dethiosulfatibacter sp.]|nr:sigma 54-interacting transcriptional regulator [Dethiosulfatibacter sp.]